METYKKLLSLLTQHERKRAVLLLIMILIMALLDMIGIASILPFMAVLTNPSLIETNFFLNNMFQISGYFGVINNTQFLFTLGVLVFVLLIFSLIFKALTLYMQVRFVQRNSSWTTSSLSVKQLEGWKFSGHDMVTNVHNNSANIICGFDKW